MILKKYGLFLLPIIAVSIALRPLILYILIEVQRNDLEQAGLRLYGIGMTFVGLVGLLERKKKKSRLVRLYMPGGLLAASVIDACIGLTSNSFSQLLFFCAFCGTNLGMFIAQLIDKSIFSNDSDPH